MKAKLSCKASFKVQQVQKWTHLFNAAVPMHKHCARSSTTFHGIATTPKTVARANQLFSATEGPFTRKKQNVSRKNLTFKSHPWFMKTKLSCEGSFKFQELKIWKRRFRARPPSNFKSWRFENDAFVRGLLQISRVEDLKTKLSCEASFKFHWRDENEAFVRGLLEIPLDKEMKAKLSCEAAFKVQQVQKWTHLFNQFHCARSSTTYHGKATTPKTVARANQLFSATEGPFTRKKQNVSRKNLTLGVNDY